MTMTPDDKLDLFVNGMTLDEWEAEWRDEDVIMHDVDAITERVQRTQESESYEEIAVWLAAIERYWRQRPAYPKLRDALIARLVELQAANERQVYEHRDAVRRRYACQAWADHALGTLGLGEV